MLLTWTGPATQNQIQLDALNHTNGKIYSRVMQLHRAIDNHTRVWLSATLAEKLDDALNNPSTKLRDNKIPSPLHSHRIDAAIQGFYKAVKTARKLRKSDEKARFPYKRKRLRPTIFKTSALRVAENQVRLSVAQRHFLKMTLPRPLQGKSNLEIREVRLVYNRTSLGNNDVSFET